MLVDAHEIVLWQLAVQEEAVNSLGDALVAARVGDVGVAFPGDQLCGVELLSQSLGPLVRVAASPVVPTTRIGAAPVAWTSCGMGSVSE